MKAMRAAALLGLVLLSSFPDIVSGQQWASCSEYQLSGSGNLACPRIFQPVCGTDNVTYPNECSLCRQILLSGTVDKKHDGRCVKVDCTGYMRRTGRLGKACIQQYSPIYATNGVMYINKCTFCTAVANGEDIDVLPTDGKYPEIDCSNFKRTDLYCTEEYVPHCGSDGVTYGNKCYFCIAVLKSHGSLSLQHLGEC
ncbi:ovomucoid-like [Coturnix japonica]|uniref:ovomucoid-like n=1 Tax=Coturnix japonica TaxID=93934 RepID=UPI000776E3D6|nr:ovomucoid-like [Coturnix japonica]XP_015731908.1 ovomucoid-like [Coturnix japonica]XP_032303403.1 ovomucoid-like [Coturnix japonica]